MELQWIGVAFVLGFLAYRLRQPPLIGFLLAGFGLEFLGFRPDSALRQLAHVGILLLLFGIGLKFRVRTIVRRQVLGTAIVHLCVFVGLVALALLVGRELGVGMLAGADPNTLMIIAFALSFSSTVFAVKVLEGRDDMNATYGRVAIGILVVQDIVAVAFVTASEGSWPSPWALALVFMVPLGPVLRRVLEWCGHRELLLLAGLTAALGGAALFEAVGLKSDLGALAAGILLGGGGAKSRELSRALLSLKEVFLVGFFLSIGFTGLPTTEMLITGLALGLVLPLKWAFFALLLGWSRLRARTAFLGASVLTTFSEFGLIVVAVAASRGSLSSQWGVVLAIALGASFVLASTLNGRAFVLYRRLRSSLRPFERRRLLTEEATVEIGYAQALVFGLGQIGVPAYDTLRRELGDVVVGFDVDQQRVVASRRAGRNVYVGSATDADFWERFRVDREGVDLVLLSMSTHRENLEAIRQLRAEGYGGRIGVTTRFEDERGALVEAGATVVFHTMADVGRAFATRTVAGPGDEVE